MSKIAILGDIHIGVRNDTILFLYNQLEFFQEIFFPKLIEENIKTVVILGDVFDRRKYINFHTLYQSHSFLFKRFAELDIKVILITGNHDVYHKNSNEINSLDLLLSNYSNFTIHSDPTVVDIEGTKVTLIPWMNRENLDDCQEFINKKESDILMGHFEINGFMMHKNTIACRDGIDPDVFAGYDLVLSGHFHQRSNNTLHKIYYMGSPSQHTWNDADSERGFHLLELETRELTFVENPYILFHKIMYDENMDLLEVDFSQYTDKILQVIVDSRGDRHHYDLFIQKLQTANPYSLDVVDNTDYQYLAENIDPEAIRSEDTISIVNSYIDSMTLDVDRTKMKTLFGELHDEAMLRLDD